MLWGVGNGPINCGNEENVGCYFPLEETECEAGGVPVPTVAFWAPVAF